MRVAITGATGLIGAALTRDLLSDGHSVVAITRPSHPREKIKPPLDLPNVTTITWDPYAGVLNSGGLTARKNPNDEIAAFVHLAGESVGGRWTSRRTEAIRSSRVKSTELLVKSIEQSFRPKVFVGASAIGYYGDRDDEELTEESAPGNGFLSQVCIEWEQASQPLLKLGISIYNARFGLVLAPDSAATKRLTRLGRFGLLGPLGGGRQWWSWITLHDAVRVLRSMIDGTQGLSGHSASAAAPPDTASSAAASVAPGPMSTARNPVNVCSPTPRRQRDFAKVLAKGLHRPALLPAPKFAVKAALGEMGQALLLDSARVVPKTLEKAAFKFDYPDLENAVQWLLESKHRAK